MKTVVLDDDPTGTQSASGVRVLLECSADAIEETLRDAESVYVQTNSRALAEADAVDLVRRIRADGEEAARRLGVDVRFVLRGDSTLRGHVFAETEVFLDGDAVMVFVPAFPDGGRTTRDGVHYVNVGGHDLPAHESEYAADPVFGFSTGVLVDYVAEKSGRTAVPVPLATVRGGGLATVLSTARPGTVVLPDAVDNTDIRVIAEAIATAGDAGRAIVVRTAAPVAAELAGVTSRGLLRAPLLDRPLPTLLVCGSHTTGATTQLAPVIDRWGAPIVVDTAGALDDPDSEGRHAADQLRAQLDARSFAVLMSERDRSSDHNTLSHGERIMTALTTAVRGALPHLSVVVAKGGITSAEVARAGIGATSALVLGQIRPGVSVWQLEDRNGRDILYVVVPGNVGDHDTLVEILDALRIGAAAPVGSRQIS
ncbi:four-carbon acid sugar kinase family protein [Mycolicibacterium smegmatis]|uniref:four-carbon acid sugar kinase family protein n=1 Tax=Mycolicibacterium smegmatis TaxID=1772 RepID=UPI001303A7BE|nr:four-carbon acid sugar kinase family protein [Mycolicibacterium smegmatis]